MIKDIKHHQKKDRQTPRQHCGFTIVEVLVTILVLAIVSLGTTGYHFHAVKRAKVGNVKMAAARLGTLVLESWKSHGGDNTYDPETLGLDIVELRNIHETYLSVVDDMSFYLTLSSEDIDSNTTTGIILRELSVVVKWRADYQPGVPQSSDPGTTFYTYTRQDQSGG